jgi:hypothetical protein
VSAHQLSLWNGLAHEVRRQTHLVSTQLSSHDKDATSFLRAGYA